MSKVFDFIQKCGVFFVITEDGDRPAGRPFGAMMEYNDCLYICTSNIKAVYHQLKENHNIQIIAFDADTRDWIRVSGQAVECSDLAVKQHMLEECPPLIRKYPTADCPTYAVFQITDAIVFLNTMLGAIRMDE